MVVDRYDTSNAAYGIAVQDCYAYVSTFYYTEDLLVLDVSNPADMIQIGRLVLEHEGGSAVEVRGDYAYVASRGVAVIDVSDPTSPYMVGYLPLEAGVWDLALKGHYVLALGQWRGEVAVVNVADPTAPFLAARIYTPMETKGIQVSRNRAYIACQYAGIQVVNLTDPCHPFVEGFVSTDYSPFGVVASCRKHGLLYTALMTSGLQVSPDACTLNAIPGPAGERLPEVTDGRYSLNLQLSGFRDPGDNRGSFTDLDHPMVGDPTRLPFDRPVTGLFPDPAPDDGLTSPICGAKMEAQPQHAEDATTSLMVSPNPANPGTRISFRLTGTQRVRLGIHDLTGRQVVLLVDEELPAGVHTFDWNGADRRGRKVPSGVYLVRMTAGHQAWSRRITIVR